MSDLVVLADDLSGACEAASAALLRTTRIRVHLDASTGAAEPAGRADPRVVAVDLDTRRADPATVAAAVARVARLVDPLSLLVVKVDSLLRGRPDLLVGAVRVALTGEDRPILVLACPATPALSRTAVGGVVHVGGTPLHHTDLWHAEGRPTPTSVADAVGAAGAPVVTLAVVRGPRDGLVAALAPSRATGVVVCDAETESDLDALLAAAVAVPGVRPVLVGAGGIAAAAARSLRPDAEHALAIPEPTTDRVLVVVGSAAPLVGREVDELRATGAAVVDLAVDDLLAGTATVASPARGVTVVRPGPAVVDPASSAALVHALADAVADAAGAAGALVLTGGETARAVLDRLGTGHLSPVAATGGAVTARADDGRVVVTRPGSFGGTHSLAAIVSSLTPRAPKEPT